MMIRLCKPVVVIALVLVAIASCRKDDRTEPQEVLAQTLGDSITLSLSAEIGFEDDGDLKGLIFKLEDINGKRIPRPQFADGQRVEVHTILKGTNGVFVAKTLEWEWDAREHKLRLRHSAAGNEFAVTGLGDDTGIKWYISGLLAPGTTLSGTQVAMQGLRELRGVRGDLGEAVGKLNVPYAFGWAELRAETDKGRDGRGYRYAIGADAVAFRPLGALVAYKLGNRLTMGNYTFAPTGLMVSSDVYGDKGVFELNTTIPSSDMDKALPTWAEVREGMSYTFVGSDTPPVIAHGASLGHVYYAWVMPHTASVARAKTRVMVKGESSRTSAPDYTKTYYTDYTPEGKTSGGKVTSGSFHLLRANVIRRVALPIEYVADYNLAGGLQFNVKADGRDLEGMKGDLRFSNTLSDGTPNPNPYHIDQSGIYSGDEILGRYHENANPSRRHLQADIEIAFKAGKYFIPEADHWWGVYPAQSQQWVGYPSEQFNRRDCFQLGYGEGRYFHALSDIAYGHYDPPGKSTRDDADAVVYAIMFKPATDLNPEIKSDWFWDEVTKTYEPRTYEPLTDNSLKCAYRFTRVGGFNSWQRSQRPDHQIRIDVVYLGDADFSEEGKTELQTISSQSWWDSSTSSRLAKGLSYMHTRVIPTSLFVQYDVAPSTIRVLDISNLVSYWSVSLHAAPSNYKFWSIRSSSYNMQGSVYSSPHALGSVRLFKRDPDIP